MLTAEQRYWQAHRKAQIMANRDIRRFLAGEIGMVECAADRERAFLIAAIDKALHERWMVQSENT